MARISSEEAVAAVGNRYDLVLIAARRTRELAAGWPAKVDNVTSPGVTALREIEQGLVGRDYLKKPTEVESERTRQRREM
jgi:DNA-directed RNA polymerase subunit omega